MPRSAAAERSSLDVDGLRQTATSRNAPCRLRPCGYCLGFGMKWPPGSNRDIASPNPFFGITSLTLLFTRTSDHKYVPAQHKERISDGTTQGKCQLATVISNGNGRAVNADITAPSLLSGRRSFITFTNCGCRTADIVRAAGRSERRWPARLLESLAAYPTGSCENRCKVIM